MAYDVYVAVYDGMYSNAIQLTNLETLESFTFESDQYQGMGPGSFVIRSKWEDLITSDLLAPNRLDVYLRLDTITQSVNAGSTTLRVNVGSRFKVNQTIGLYDGINMNYALITAVSGNTITLGTALANNYSINATVMVMRYRGKICQRDATTDLDYKITLTTQGYFGELTGIIDNSNIVAYDLSSIIKLCSAIRL